MEVPMTPLADMMDVDDVIAIVAAAEKQQRVAQLGKKYDAGVHILLSWPGFRKLINYRLAVRTETGFWSFQGALLWVE